MAGHSEAYGYFLTETKRPLQKRALERLDPAADEVVVKVSGCGVCHTDIGFAYDEIPTRKPLPLVLGHEIAGKVVAAGPAVQQWLHQRVIVPAVSPCGNCPACCAGRPTICRGQFMPGNDGNGGFATHVRVPARGLCPVPAEPPNGPALALFSVVADGVTTPYEAIRRSRLGPKDIAVVVGVGGIGGFGVQIAAALGAAVIAVDIDRERLDLAAQHGASLALDAGSMSASDLKAAVRAFVKQSGRQGIGLKVFEMSGTPAGQATAFSLIDHGGYLGVVGYTAKSVELRLSNLMALDATAQGNWGCPPEYYPAALGLILRGQVVIAPYVELHPLDDAPQIFDAVARRAIKKRVIFTPPGAENERLGGTA